MALAQGLTGPTAGVEQLALGGSSGVGMVASAQRELNVVDRKIGG